LIKPTDIPCIDPRAVLREDFEDWTILFHPLTGEAVGLDPVGVMTWKLIDGRRNAGEIAAALKSRFEDAPPSIREDTLAFLQSLYRRLLVRLEGEKPG
jgi:hypothetical protein